MLTKSNLLFASFILQFTALMTWSKVQLAPPMVKISAGKHIDMLTLKLGIILKQDDRIQKIN